MSEALTRVGRTIAASANFRTLQKSLTTQLGFYDKPLSFDLLQSFSAEGGWGTGVTINSDGSITGKIDSFIFATDAILPNVGDECHKNNYIEFTYSGDQGQPVTLALWPVSEPVNALKPSVLADQPEMLFGVTVEQGAGTSVSLSAWANGDPVLNPDLTAPVAAGDRVRINFPSSGQVTVQLFEPTTSVVKGEYPLVTYDDVDVPLTISQSFIPVLLFHEENAKVSKVRIGVVDPCLAAIDERLIVDSIAKRGGVSFEDGKPLGYVSVGNLRGLPRIKGQWYWTDENRQIRIFPSPMAQKTFTAAETSIWRYDSTRRAWVSIPSVPSGVTLTPATIISEYDPDTVLLVANRDYTINTTKEEQSVKLPINAADGTVIRLADSGVTWATNPLTLLAVNGDVLLDMQQTRRRIVITANTIPTIEEVPFETGEAVINALLEIGLERRKPSDMKARLNQSPVPVADVVE